MMANKGGAGNRTMHKWCYACNMKVDVDAFSKSQWDVTESEKKRRCSACITAGRKVSMATAGQLTLFGMRVAASTSASGVASSSSTVPPQPADSAAPPPPPPLASNDTPPAAASSSFSAAEPPPPPPAETHANNTNKISADAIEARIKLIISRSAEKNTSFDIPAPLLTAAIRATVAHARAGSETKGRFTKLRLADYVEPDVDGVPQRDSFFNLDAELILCNWTAVGHTRFKCECGSETLYIVKDMNLNCEKCAAHDPLPLSQASLSSFPHPPSPCVCCCRYSCFGLSQTGFICVDARTLVTSPLLSCKACSVSELPMHADVILKQIPPKLRHHYPVRRRRLRHR